MTIRTYILGVSSLVIFCGWCGISPTWGAQDSDDIPNLDGVWNRAVDNSDVYHVAVSTSDIYRYLAAEGTLIPFTPYGADRYRNVDFATNPNGFCLNPGPSRSITGPSIFQIVQGSDTIAMLFENHGVFRLIYLDGRDHPEWIEEYPQHMGHSIGWWEESVLVVDTVGLHPRTWLDSSGLEHSDQLHLTERFEKTGPDVIRYSVTYDDPIFFARPWTLEINLDRQETELIEYQCVENEKDSHLLESTFPHLDMDIPTF